MLASAVMDALATCGIAVAAHAFDMPAAFAWLDQGLITDVALIDVMLPGGAAYPIVDRLKDALIYSTHPA